MNGFSRERRVRVKVQGAGLYLLGRAEAEETRSRYLWVDASGREDAARYGINPQAADKAILGPLQRWTGLSLELEDVE